ncbi:hypothetical protein N1851_027268 [Merluccius polli]|uniref:Uncharacterized protein n=1 Tax=Merluccius polli TaxID=89951 RepID=A0AA47MAD9_MERPO|nr:hypothetical protein N1851_027268 [Merluccius polli]
MITRAGLANGFSGHGPRGPPIEGARLAIPPPRIGPGCIAIGAPPVGRRIDLQTILKKLVSKVDGSFCPTSNQINVCRNNVLLCSLRAFKRRYFNPEAKLDVVFVDEDDNGEGAVDEGSPTRKYLRLLMRAIHQSNIFEGQ